MAIPMLALERQLRRTGGPGIIPFELAGTSEKSKQIIEAWGPTGRRAARTSLVLDYPYLVTYAGLQAALCELAGDALRRRGSRWLAPAGPLLGKTQWAAGAFDALENAALLAVLAGGSERLPALAKRCASAKFALLGLGWAYMATALVSSRRGSSE